MRRLALVALLGALLTPSVATAAPPPIAATVFGVVDPAPYVWGQSLTVVAETPLKGSQEAWVMLTCQSADGRHLLPINYPTGSSIVLPREPIPWFQWWVGPFTGTCLLRLGVWNRHTFSHLAAELRITVVQAG